MPAMDEAFWANLDAQIVAHRQDGQDKPPAAPAQPAPVIAAAPRAPPDALRLDRRARHPHRGQERRPAAGRAAARAGPPSRDALLQDLKRSQQEVRAFEVLLREAQVQADARAGGNPGPRRGPDR